MYKNKFQDCSSRKQFTKQILIKWEIYLQISYDIYNIFTFFKIKTKHAQILIVLIFKVLTVETTVCDRGCSEPFLIVTLPNLQSKVRWFSQKGRSKELVRLCENKGMCTRLRCSIMWGYANWEDNGSQNENLETWGYTGRVSKYTVCSLSNNGWKHGHLNPP